MQPVLGNERRRRGTEERPGAGRACPRQRAGGFDRTVRLVGEAREASALQAARPAARRTGPHGARTGEEARGRDPDCGGPVDAAAADRPAPPPAPTGAGVSGAATTPSGRARTSARPCSRGQCGGGLRQALLPPRRRRDSTARSSTSPAVDFGAKGKHDVVYVVTMNDSVYAFDAADARRRRCGRRTTRTPPRASRRCPTRDLGRATLRHLQGHLARVGILSTPAIDPATQDHVPRRAHEGGGRAVLPAPARHQPRRRRRAAGQPGRPSRRPPAAATGRQAGMIEFDPAQAEPARGAAPAPGGRVHRVGLPLRQAPYHGWLLGYDAKTLAAGGGLQRHADGAHGRHLDGGPAPVGGRRGQHLPHHRQRQRRLRGRAQPAARAS